MPIRESACENPACSEFGVRREWLERSGRTDPFCPACNWQMKRLISAARICWTRPLEEYGDPRGETYHKDVQRGGHWVARRRSQGGTEEHPKFELIQSRQQQVAYCREEGLLDPAEMPAEMTISQDGKTANTQGNRGSWI